MVKNVTTDQQGEYRAICLGKVGRQSFAISFTGVNSPLLEPVTATQSSTLDDRFIALNCIDGGTGGSDRGGDQVVDLCQTEEEEAPWIAVDYGRTVTVDRVEIFNRVACCGERTMNVDVRISDELPTSGSEMFSGGNLLGHFPGAASNGQHIIIRGEKQLLNNHY